MPSQSSTVKRSSLKSVRFSIDPEQSSVRFRLQSESASVPSDFGSFAPAPPPTKSPFVHPTVYRTQKAKGTALAVRSSTRWQAYSGLTTPSRMEVVDAATATPEKAKDAMRLLGKFVKTTVFARPAPMTPRHGFVESRPVKTAEELEVVCKEAVAADPMAEVILMPRLTANWSGVMTQNGLVVGKGHDGATSGRPGTVNIPIRMSTKRFRAFIGEKCCKDAGIVGSPFVELVEDQERVVSVQLRDGPELSGSPNYIPAPMKVRAVYSVSPKDVEDLLQWEERCVSWKNSGAVNGLVAWLPGGNMSSHIAVQCVVHGIAFMTTPEPPKVGDRILPDSTQAPKLKAADYRAIARGIAAALDYNYEVDGKSDKAIKASQWVKLAVGTIHALLAWGNDPHLLMLRGLGFGAAIKLVAAACAGELRHYYFAGPGRPYLSSGESYSFKPWCVPEDKKAWVKRKQKESGWVGVPALSAKWLHEVSWPRKERESVYKAFLGLSGQEIADRMPDIVCDLSRSGWHSSFGGKAWADAAFVCLAALRIATHFIHHPTAKQWNAVVSIYNKLINTVHNGGKVYTKWVGNDMLDIIAENPVLGFLNDRVITRLLNGGPWPTYSGSLKRYNLIIREESDVKKEMEAARNGEDEATRQAQARAGIAASSTQERRKRGGSVRFSIDPRASSVRFRIAT